MNGPAQSTSAGRRTRPACRFPDVPVTLRFAPPPPSGRCGAGPLRSARRRRRSQATSCRWPLIIRNERPLSDNRVYSRQSSVVPVRLCEPAGACSTGHDVGTAIIGSDRVCADMDYAAPAGRWHPAACTARPGPGTRLKPDARTQNRARNIRIFAEYGRLSVCAARLQARRSSHRPAHHDHHGRRRVRRARIARRSRRAQRSRRCWPRWDSL